MKISGHKTDAMERRYNIVDLDDLRELRGRLDLWFPRTVAVRSL